MVNIGQYSALWVSLADIDFSDKAYQYRKQVEVADAADLMESFKESGQEFPVIVRQLEDGRKQIICGFRRYTAAKALGWEKILAVIVPAAELPDKDAEKLSVDENVKRKSLTNLDIMFLCKKLSELGRSNVDIGAYIGKSEAQVRRYIKIANSPVDVQEKVKSGDMTVTEAGSAGARPEDEQKNMSVKSTKNGIFVKFKYYRKKDNLDEAIAFIKKVLDTLTTERDKAGQ